MAKGISAEAQAERSRILDEKKQLKKDLKDQRKEVKRRAQEIAKQEEALGYVESNGFVTFAATLLIIILWLAVICVIVKLDIGGFGSSVLQPILKDVPVVNRILPGVPLSGSDSSESYGGYSSLQEAVDYIRELELQISQLQSSASVKDSDLENLRAENARLREFENVQVEFSRIQEEFWEDVVSSDPEEFRKWFEEMNPETAQAIYRQVVIQSEESTEFQAFAQLFAEMKPRTAAQSLESMMSTDANQAARILGALSTEEQAKIMDQMSADTVARLAKLMNPDS